MKRNKPFLRRTPLRKMSPKRRKESVWYGILRIGYLLKHPQCEVPWCEDRATQIHHKKGRGANYLKTNTWLATCDACHRQIHNFPLWAKKHGLLAT